MDAARRSSLTSFEREIFESWLERNRKKAKLYRKTAVVEGYECSYFDSYESDISHEQLPTETVLFLHGFASQKSTWLPMIKKIRKQQRKMQKGRKRQLTPPLRILAPDLLGHGETRPSLPSGDYRIETQVSFLNGFLLKVLGKYERVHIVGKSMGGFIAGVFAATHPERVRSVSLICPAGIQPKEKPILLQRLEKGGVASLLPADDNAITELLAIYSYKKMWLPKPLRKRMLDNVKEKSELLLKVLQDLAASGFLLEESLDKIKAPTAVFWGKQDNIIPVSCVDVVKDKVVNPYDIKVIDKCGHEINGEQDEVVATLWNLINHAAPSQPSESRVLHYARKLVDFYRWIM